MIIVKTSNGDKFVNDKAALLVDHDKESEKVYIIATDGTYTDPPIEHVEMVIYANDAQPTQWKDEGSVIEQLRATIEHQKDDVDYARSIMRTNRQMNRQSYRVIDEVKNQLRLREDARSWERVEDIIKDVEKAIEEITTEHNKIIDEYNEKRLKPCKG